MPRQKPDAIDLLPVITGPVTTKNCCRNCLLTVNKYFFKNEMHIPSLMINNLIYTADPIKWTFSCDYPTTYDVSGINGNLVMASSGESASFESTGSFEIDLSLFETDTFENKDSDPLFKVGRAVNFGSKFVEPLFQWCPFVPLCLFLT